MSAQGVIAAHRLDGPGCTGCGWHIHPLVSDQIEALHAAHQLDALTAAGFAVVELPKPDMTGEHQFSESEGHAVANFFSEDCEEWVMSCCGEVSVNGLPPKMSPDYARSFAGRVLAAATHAEAVRGE